MTYKVHQFRYVISAQQAQWVRDNYKKDGMTDEEALAAYLSTLKEGDDSGEYSLMSPHACIIKES
ncbi:DUF3114 domain-containing protein [Streptococcus criceti]